MKNNNKSNKIAYMLLEGSTEEVFYRRLFSKHLRGIPKKIESLDGNGGVNSKIIKKLDYFLRCNENANTNVFVYVFLDRECTEAQKPDFDAKEILKKLDSKTIRKIERIEAILMIESWFFYDIKNICKYLKIKISDSLMKNYNNPNKLTSHDLSDLFRKGVSRKYYKKGDEKFQEILDIDEIYNNCNELRNGIQTIIRDLK